MEKEINRVLRDFVPGKNPQLYFPRSRIRFIRFEGVQKKKSIQSEILLKDVIVWKEQYSK